MKKLFLLPLFLFALKVNAQQLIAVESGGTSTFYSDLDTALGAAPTGATVYLPGITFSKPNGNYVISKQINLIGAGHYPDSTGATGRTIINNSVNILSNAGNSSFTGMQFNSGVIDSASNILIYRCRIGPSANSFSGGFVISFPNINHVNFFESLISYFSGYGNTQDVTISNCIVERYVSGILSNGNISNSIFLSDYGYPSSVGNFLFLSVSNSTIANNIFFMNNGSLGNGYDGVTLDGSSQNTILSNCVFTDQASDSNYVIRNGAIGSLQYNNKFGIPINQIFINQSGNAFNYLHNYRLVSGSPALTSGVGGTQCGIYGGLSPYKTSAVPYNPHISRSSIGTTTTPDGNLQVLFRIIAQDH